MLKDVKAYFYHHRKERNGTIAVMSLILFILIATEVGVRYIKPPTYDLAFVQAFDQEISERKRKAEEAARLLDSLGRFDFNPNSLSDSGYTALGFSEKEIQMLRNYHGKAGDFKSKLDFKKLYFIDGERFDRLKDYIQLPDSPEFPEYKTKKFREAGSKVKWSDTADFALYEYNPIRADLNHADTTELKSLPGIGSFYAKMIVEYRGQLGGYSNLSQLMEIYRMTPENIDRFADKLSVDQSTIKKLRLNSATAQELSAHPYITFALASKLVTSRESQGNFLSRDDLKKRGLVSRELSLKLAPYLQFD